MGIKNELKTITDRLDLLEEANNSITKHMNECVEEAMNFKIDEIIEKDVFLIKKKLNEVIICLNKK